MTSVDDGMLVEVVDGSEDAVLEFFLAHFSSAAENTLLDQCAIGRKSI
ncbi:MAG: hypothetical protein P9C48_10020 [Defluviicoccus sp.]|nr:hypothetical protein [Defluviicoccus sp.]MDG4609451.1 hypothetical protein [Defluviicoccus sp.]